MIRPVVDPLQLPLLLRATPMVGVAVLALWVMESPHMLVGRWDVIGMPMLALVMLAATAVMYWRPAWATAAMLCVLGSSAVYLQGILFFNLFAPSPLHLYSLMSTAQFMPLFYLAAFAAFQQGAAALCWLQYSLLVLQVMVSMLIPGPHETTLLMQAKAGVLLAQPLFILVLTFMERLRHKINVQERESYRGKERLLAMMSHEIRGPLQTMLSSVDLLSTKVQDASSARAVQRLGGVAEQLDRHLKDLLEFTRLDNPDLTIEQRAYDLEALVRATCEAYQDTAQARGLTLRARNQPTPNPEVPQSWRQALGDPDRVRQVLGNLVGNAIKYTPSGSVTVWLSAPPRQPGWARIDVVDTGEGIAPEQQPMIFEPFVRLNPPQGAAREGSGLGLAITARLVERLGGRIDVVSEPGYGSQFTVMLPLGPVS